MAIYDLVGVPFPKDAPEFKDSQSILQAVKRIEHDVEIRADLLACVSVWDTLDQLLVEENKFQENLSLDAYFELCDATVAHAIHLYSKAFNGNDRRRRLDHKVYLSKASPDLLEAHYRFYEFRDKHFAHAELRLNEHELFVLPGSDQQPLALNPFAQVGRTILAKSYDWSKLREVAQFIGARLESEVLARCSKLESKLSLEQKSCVNRLRRAS